MLFKKPKGLKKKQSRKKKKSCYYSFDKKGHFAKNCRRQLNDTLRKEHRAEIKIDYTPAAIAEINTVVHEFISQRLKTPHSGSTKDEKNNDSGRARKAELNEHMERIMQVLNKKPERYHGTEKKKQIKRNTTNSIGLDAIQKCEDNVNWEKHRPSD